MGSQLGIARTANVSNSVFGTQNTYANFSNTTTAYRAGGLVESASVNLVEDGQFVDGNVENITPATLTNTSLSDVWFSEPLSDGLKALSEEDMAAISDALDNAKK